MVQPEFNLYLRFKSYDFLFNLLKQFCMHVRVSGVWVDVIAYHGTVKWMGVVVSPWLW